MLDVKGFSCDNSRAVVMWIFKMHLVRADEVRAAAVAAAVAVVVATVAVVVVVFVVAVVVLAVVDAAAGVVVVEAFFVVVVVVTVAIGAAWYSTVCHYIGSFQPHIRCMHV